MASPQSSPVLAQLRDATSFSEQAAALRTLKNEIVGHDQKKEAWIPLGVLEPIVRSLSSAHSPVKSTSKDARLQLTVRPLSDADVMRLQALQLITSFAKGGPPFLPPLYAARAVPAVLTCISPSINSPQIVIAALEALTDIAEASALALPSSPLDIQTLAKYVFTSQHLESLCLMFATTSPKYSQQTQISLATGLVCRLCRDERHQDALATSGVLDMLATQLASFAVGHGYVVPGAEERAYSDGLFEVLPEPAHPGAKIAPIFEAIGCIIGDSKYRAIRLVHSPSILAVFPSIRFDSFKGSSQGLALATLGGSRQQNLTAMDYLLPTAPPLSRSSPPAQSPLNAPDRSDSQTSSLTPSARFSSSVVWGSSSLVQPAGKDGDDTAVEIESPLIPWIVLQMRCLEGYGRLTAATVLTALIKAGLGRKGTRETSLGLLVIPLLVRMMTKVDFNSPESEADGHVDATQRFILERAPAILARLITDSEYLQKAAFDCGAARVLTDLLKRAYQPVWALAQPKVWSPQPDTGMDVEESAGLWQLGGEGQNPDLVYRLKLRESVLNAIGALASGKEDYRKALASEDFIAYVVESLTESPAKPQTVRERPKEKPKEESELQETSSSSYGVNPLSVIIAGCHVVRMMARSISILRTSLVDHAVALPICQYLRHPDVNVQIAATATVCNLVVEVSPVRELLTENGVMQVLCEHAHSDNPALRLNALWALKHYVVAVSPGLKKACLEQLEPGWLVQLICGDGRDAASHNAHSKPSPGGDLDEEMDAPPPSDEPFQWLYAANGCLRELDASRSSRLRQAENKLASIRESELNPTWRARNDDLAIQEQGLDLIRNLIGPATGPTADLASETTEMIDHIFGALGQDRLFEILTSRLRSRVLHPFSRRMPAPGREARLLRPKAKIIAAVIFILVHMAASNPRHRQLVVAQTELLGLVAQQSSSKDKEVRVALCHLVINLTAREDEGELEACAQRALELKNLGFHNKMEMLKQSDRDLDVQERAKTAVWQIEHAAAY